MQLFLVEDNGYEQELAEILESAVKDMEKHIDSYENPHEIGRADFVKMKTRVEDAFFDKGFMLSEKGDVIGKNCLYRIDGDKKLLCGRLIAHSGIAGQAYFHIKGIIDNLLFTPEYEFAGLKLRVKNTNRKPAGPEN